ncbi:MAG: hypothetical protein WBZ40_04035 [Acidimicrobiia bacterium]
MRRRFVILAIMAMLAAACGGGSSDPTSAGEPATTVGASATDTPQDDEQTAAEDGDPAAEESEPNAPVGSASSGTVVVDGDTFEVTEMYRCEPYADPGREADPDDLDLVAFAADSRYLSLTISNTESVNMSTGETFPGQFYDLRLDVATADGQVEYELGATNDQDGNWTLGDDTGTPLDSPPFTIDGNNISGGMTLVETYPNEGDTMVSVTYDLEIPNEIRDCSAG